KDQANANLQRYLGLVHYRVATLARKRNDAETAERSNKTCLEIREKLAAANESRQMDLLLVLPRRGQHARAAELAAKLQKSAKVDKEMLVDLAQCYAKCAAAVSGQAELQKSYCEQTVAALSQAVDKGFNDAELLETEPDFDGVRANPGFKALLVRLRGS